MGKVEKLPRSKSLGSVVGAEIRLNQGSPKASKRAIGAAESIIKASRPGAVAGPEKKRRIVASQIDSYAASQISDRLQGIVDTSQSVSESLTGTMEPVTVFEAGRVYDKIGQIFPEEPLSLDALKEEANILSNSERHDARNGFYDYGSTARDLRE